jgi:hypothetical protein
MKRIKQNSTSQCSHGGLAATKKMSLITAAEIGE